MKSSYQPGQRVSEYVLEERVGTGTFGEVWQARHHIWENDRVAIKLPTEPEYVRYLQREGVVVHGLRHPNIVRAMGLDPYADIPYLVMELVRGPSLRQVINEHPQGVPVDIAVVIVRGILGALTTAHTNNVLHRDLKPGNVMLDLGDRSLTEVAQTDVKVSDFGLGVGSPETLQSIVQSASIDREDRLVGTMAYMAPELRDGRQKADQRTDLYSVGVVLFELLTGERPAGAELPSTLRADVPKALDDVFRGLYARYDRRYDGAQAVLDDLDRRLRPQEAVVVPPPLPPQTPVSGTSRRSCPGCGNVVEPHDQFCTQCGRQLVGQVHRCASCGAFPGPDDVYCIFCGAKVT
jgi:serine/threonine-protein kinase